MGQKKVNNVTNNALRKSEPRDWPLTHLATPIYFASRFKDAAGGPHKKQLMCFVWKTLFVQNSHLPWGASAKDNLCTQHWAVKLFKMFPFLLFDTSTNTDRIYFQNNKQSRSLQNSFWRTKKGEIWNNRSTMLLKGVIICSSLFEGCNEGILLVLQNAQ